MMIATGEHAVAVLIKFVGRWAILFSIFLLLHPNLVANFEQWTCGFHLCVAVCAKIHGKQKSKNRNDLSDRRNQMFGAAHRCESCADKISSVSVLMCSARLWTKCGNTMFVGFFMLKTSQKMKRCVCVCGAFQLNWRNFASNLVQWKRCRFSFFHFVFLCVFNFHFDVKAFVSAFSWFSVEWKVLLFSLWQYIEFSVCFGHEGNDNFSFVDECVFCLSLFFDSRPRSWWLRCTFRCATGNVGNDVTHLNWIQMIWFQCAWCVSGDHVQCHQPWMWP